MMLFMGSPSTWGLIFPGCGRAKSREGGERKCFQLDDQASDGHGTEFFPLLEAPGKCSSVVQVRFSSCPQRVQGLVGEKGSCARHGYSVLSEEYQGAPTLARNPCTWGLWRPSQGCCLSAVLRMRRSWPGTFGVGRAVGWAVGIRKQEEVWAQCVSGGGRRLVSPASQGSHAVACGGR